MDIEQKIASTTCSKTAKQQYGWESYWQTQTEIVKANLQKDKWLELEFDFSGVADRKDYDKIVIQFGAEGHSGPGIFYLNV